jgi:hypothetical protein
MLRLHALHEEGDADGGSDRQEQRRRILRKLENGDLAVFGGDLERKKERIRAKPDAAQDHSDPTFAEDRHCTSPPIRCRDQQFGHHLRRCCLRVHPTRVGYA